MSRHLKLHIVELIASILLVGVYSLLFVPFVWYFDFVRPIHLAGFSGGIIVLNLLYGTIHTWWKHRGKSVPRENAEQVYEYLEELSEEFDTQKPRLIVFKSKVPNAYATDTLPTRPIVALTDTLIDDLEPRELKSVMAHEMSHIRSYDIFFMLFLSSFVNIVEYAHNTAVNFLNNADGAFETALILPFFIITYINITVVYAILFFVSRVREYVADKDAATVTSPSAMKSALQTIDTQAKSAPEAAKQQFASQSALTITPLEDLSSKLFRTHPKTEKRIAKLENLEGVELNNSPNTQEESATEDHNAREAIEGYIEDSEEETDNTEATQSDEELEETTETTEEDAENTDDTDEETEDAGVSTRQSEMGVSDTSNPSKSDDTLKSLTDVDEDDEALKGENDAEDTENDGEDDETDDETDDEDEGDDVDYPTDLSLRGDDV